MRGPPGIPDPWAETPAVGNVESRTAGPGADLGDGGVGRVRGAEQQWVGRGRAHLGRRFGGGPLPGCSEVAVGPLLSQGTGLTEDQRDGRPADLVLSQRVGDGGRTG